MVKAPEHPTDLPDDIDALKALVVEKTVEAQEQSAQAAHYKARLESLEEQIRLMKHQHFGTSSEKSNDRQNELFNEAELEALGADDEDLYTSELEEVAPDKQPAAKKRSSGRKKLPAELPRIRVEHDLDEADKVCPCGCGLTKIGEDISEQLDIIPAKIQVIQNVRIKYACKACEEGVKTAALPAQPIPKSNASPGLLAYIIVSKFMDALPLYRMETVFERLELHLPRSTMARWVIKTATLAQPLLNLIQEHINGYDIQHMDETRLQVLKEDGRAAQLLSQMWVQKGGPPDKPVILYHYDTSRARKVAERLLEGFSGYLQTDGFSVYLKLPDGITQIGCWAHARRKFNDALKAQPNGKKAGKAQMGLSFIQKLYAIEKQIKEQSPEERKRLRQSLAKPVMDKIKPWLIKSMTQILPGSKTGIALTYLHNQWDSLQYYLEDGRLNIDNNPAERAVKPFVIGRKNWLFSDTPAGASASAAMYSLIETAKANDLEPYAYLRHVFKELPKAEKLEDIEELLPFNIDAQKIKTLNAG